MRYLSLLLLVLLIALPPLATASEVKSTTLFYTRDTDVTAVEYCVSRGQSGRIFAGSGAKGDGKVSTVGSSTTISAVDTDKDAFENVIAEDDFVTFSYQGTRYTRSVLSVSEDSFTVDEAVDLSDEFEWRYYKVTCGTDSDAGAIDVGGWASALFIYDIKQLSVTGGIDIRGECRGGSPGSPWQIVTESEDEVAETAVGVDYFAVDLSEAGFEQCRFGHYIDSADDGSDTGSDREEVTAVLQLWKY